jgi:hypothetical protein
MYRTYSVQTLVESEDWKNRGYTWCCKTTKKRVASVGSHVNSPFGTSAHDLLYPFATPSFLAS